MGAPEKGHMMGAQKAHDGCSEGGNVRVSQTKSRDQNNNSQFHQ